ncbi:MULTISPECIES: hypothetical protein [unclassified Bartonella]|uniref:hypothetical protein n=1 Tax=unclassified Bartonella TaxID=2645622 RepID=UPI0035D007F1
MAWNVERRLRCGDEEFYEGGRSLDEEVGAFLRYKKALGVNKNSFKSRKMLLMTLFDR